MEQLLSGKEVFLKSSPQSQIQQLQEFVSGNFRRLAHHQWDNGLITASIEGFDDPHFKGMVWLKDLMRAIKWALNPTVKLHHPQLFDPEAVKAGDFPKTGTDLYLAAVRGSLRLQTSPQQWERFNNKPDDKPDEHGYFSIDDRVVPAIKDHVSGALQENWGNNQPDNWGILLLVVGQGINAGLPVLKKAHPDDVAPALVIDHITKYLINLKTERLNCRSLWEHNSGWSSYSTRRLVHAGLEQIAAVRDQIEDSLQYYEEKPETTKGALEEAKGRLNDYILEHFPADYTDSREHLSPGDLASLVVLSDVDHISLYEVRQIIRNTRGLMTPDGYIRYRGDPWKNMLGEANVEANGEAHWTMGLPIDAKFGATQAKRFFERNKPRANEILDFALDRQATLMAISSQFGRTPELFTVVNDPETQTLMLEANNNNLIWTNGYGIESSGACSSAILAKKAYLSRTRDFAAVAAI